MTSQDLQMSHLTKTTPQGLQMSHLTKIIPPRKKEKKTKRRENDLSRPPNETADQIYTPQEKRQEDQKTTIQKAHLEVLRCQFFVILTFCQFSWGV